MATGGRIAADEKIDHRWVRIRRPTIVVGGELTLESLEITVHKETGIGEAPLQLKSNCGTLVIDDFGRQRVAPQKLLNRWIVPLEAQHDYLGLASGRKICVPFDQFIVFSTNLEPRELVDEAFLRRIPYKIEVEDPTVEQFRKLFDETCRKQGIAFDASRAGALDPEALRSRRAADALLSCPRSLAPGRDLLPFPRIAAGDERGRPGRRRHGLLLRHGGLARRPGTACGCGGSSGLLLHAAHLDR